MNNFENHSFAKISTNCRTKQGQDLYEIGDEKTFTNSLGEKVTLVILDKIVKPARRLVVGFKHCFNRTFVVQDVLSEKGWKDSALRLETISEIEKSLPYDLQNVVKSAVIKTIVKGRLKFTADKYWLPSYKELVGHGLDEGEQFEYFKSSNDYERKTNSDIAVNYLTRTISPRYGEYVQVTNEGKFKTIKPCENASIFLCFHI